MIYNMEYLLTQATPSIGVEVKPEAAAQNPVPDQAPGGIMWFMLIFMAVIYFVMLRPHSKREKERKAALKTIKKGDKVITRGGIWGVVLSIKEEEDIIVLKIAENVKVEVSKNGVEVVNPEPLTKPKDEKPKKGFLSGLAKK